MKKYELTDEHRAQLDGWRDLWIARALRTEPMTDADRVSAKEAAEGLYRAADLEIPRVVFATSPLVIAIAGCVASGVWWIRGNAEEARKLFGTLPTESELTAATRAACITAKPHLSKYTIPAAIEAGECTGDETRAPEAVVQYLKKGIDKWYSYYNGGNMWAGWPAHISFFRHIAKLDIDYSKWQHYETGAMLPPRFMHRKFCMFADFPLTIGRDEQNRAHCETGPQLAWADGWKVYNWHGVRVPADVIENPGGITFARIQGEANQEVRRVMIDRYGWGRYLEDCGKPVHEDVDSLGLPRKLYRHEDLCLVVVQNSSLEPDGSRKTYMLKCHPELRPILGPTEFGEPQKMTCHNAVASTFGMTGAQYHPNVET